MRSTPTLSFRTVAATTLLGIVASGCAVDATRAGGILAQSIDRYGGALFDDSYIRFEFRGTAFEVLRDDGRFRYRRIVTDSTGASTTEVMENSGTWIERDGSRLELDSAGAYGVETDVNSVVYFGFLPFRLNDPAVDADHLGAVEVSGEPYHEIRVTFRPENGGVDWDTQFVYWIHRDELTVDYVAYRYSRDGGGTRFRRAVNRREIGGLLIQDYENYGASQDIDDLAEYDRLFEEDALELLSMIELEDVRVDRADAADGFGVGGDGESGTPDAGTDPAPAEGVELAAGMDRATYAPGDSVRVALELANRSTEEATLRFSDAMRYDLAVRTESGEEIIRWSDGRAFAQVVGELVLGSGEAMRFEAWVAAPTAPGRYEILGMVPEASAPLEVTLPLEVRE